MSKTGQLYRRLRWAIAIVCVVAGSALSAGTLILIHRENGRVEPEVSQNSSALSRMLSEHLGNVFVGIRRRFALARFGPDHTLTRESRHELGGQEGVTFWFVVDAQGRLVDSTNPSIQKGRRLNLPPAGEVLALAAESGLFIGDPESTLGTMSRFVPILQPILKAGGAVSHYIGAALDVRYFDRFFLDLQAWGENGIVIIADSGPIILRYPHIPGVIGRDVRGKSPVWDKARKEGAGWFYENSPVDGVEKMTFFRKVPGAPVIVMVNRAKDEIFRNWSISAWIRLATLLIGLIAIGTIGAILSRQLERLSRDEENLRVYRAYALRIQKLESMGRFAGGIAHDFNNILTILFGHLDRLARELPVELHPISSRLMETALRARDLVRRILSFSRPTSGGVRSISVDRWLDETRPLLLASVPSGVRLRIDVKPGLHVYGDPDHLTQVVMHLLDNSTESISGSGEIEIQMGSVASTSRPEVRIVVRDTGSGIAPENLHRVFSPFYSTKDLDGAGLGLAITKSLVESAGGRIQLSSRRGEGTTVEIRWPESRVLSGPPLSSTAGRRSATRILFVDDEKSVVEFAKEAFAAAGLSAFVFFDPVEALDNFRRAPDEFSLLITDINMRRMSGFELADEVRRIKPSLPVIYVTAHPEFEIEAERRKQADPHGSEFLRKPYRIESLVDLAIEFSKSPVLDETVATH